MKHMVLRPSRSLRQIRFCKTGTRLQVLYNSIQWWKIGIQIAYLAAYHHTSCFSRKSAEILEKVNIEILCFCQFKKKNQGFFSSQN